MIMSKLDVFSRASTCINLTAVAKTLEFQLVEGQDPGTPSHHPTSIDIYSR